MVTPTPPPPPPPPPDLAPTHRAALGLVFAYAAVIVVSVVFGIYYWRMSASSDFDGASYRKWSLVRSSMNLALFTVGLAGAIDLYKRTTGTAQIGARVALAAAVVLLAGNIVRQYLDHIYLAGDYGGPRFATYESVTKWVSRASTLSWLGLAAGISIAGWHVRRVRILAGPLLLMTLVAIPFDFYSEPLSKLLYGTHSAARSMIVGSLVDAVLGGLAIAILLASPPRVEALGFDRAARGLDRTAMGLFIQAWVMVVSILFIFMLFSSKGSGGAGLMKLYVIGGPLVMAAAVMIAISGILGAGGLLARGAPRLQLYGAAAGFTITFAITVIQVVIAVKVMNAIEHGDFDNDQASLVQALPIFKAALGFATLMLLVWGLHGLERAVGRTEIDAPRSLRTGGIVLVCQLVSIFIPWAMSKAEDLSPGNALFGLTMIMVVGIISLIAIARTCRALATAARLRHDLPVGNVFT